MSNNNVVIIETLDDIFKYVNYDNLDRFMIDLRGYILAVLGTQDLINSIADAEKMPRTSVELSHSFGWIDDGKNEVIIEFHDLNESRNENNN